MLGTPRATALCPRHYLLLPITCDGARPFALGKGWGEEPSNLPQPSVAWLASGTLGMSSCN